MNQGREWVFRVKGDFGFFGGLSFGPERMSSLIPSYSGVEGINRSCMGKPEYRWVPESVTLLKMPGYYRNQSNELRDFKSDGVMPPDLTGRGTQRMRVYLTNVDFVIRARLRRNPRWAREEDTLAKADAMVERRIRQGGRRYQVVLGPRECTGYLSEVRDGASPTYVNDNGNLGVIWEKLPPPIDLTQNLGMVFYGRDFDGSDEKHPKHYLAPMTIEKGVARYPTWDEVRKYGHAYDHAWVQ